MIKYPRTKPAETAEQAIERAYSVWLDESGPDLDGQARRAIEQIIYNTRPYVDAYTLRSVCQAIVNASHYARMEGHAPRCK